MKPPPAATGEPWVLPGCPDPAEHQGLITTAALAVLPLARRAGLELDDLKQEGQLALRWAIRRYDPSKGYAFSTFATPCIRNWLKQAIQNAAGPCRIPVTARWAVRRARTGKPNHYRGQALQQIEQALESHQGVAGAAALACVAEELDDGPDRATIESLYRHMESLPERERHVLRRRFGLEGTAPLERREIGEHLGLTYTQVWKLEQRAIKTLRGLMGDQE